MSGPSRINQKVAKAVASYEQAPALASLLETVVHVWGADLEIAADSLRRAYRRRANRLRADGSRRQEVEALVDVLNEFGSAPVRLVAATGSTGAKPLVLLDGEMPQVLFMSPYGAM